MDNSKANEMANRGVIIVCLCLQATFRPSEAEQDEPRIYVIKPGKMPSKHKSDKHRLIPMSIPIKDSDQQPNKKSTRSHCQPFKEEDYIVFCVKDDGTFDVVRDQKTESVQHVKYRTEPPRTINRKLVYGEDANTESKYDNEDGIDFDATDEEFDIFADEVTHQLDLVENAKWDPYTLGKFEPHQQGEDEQSIYFDSEAPQPGIRAEAHLKKGNDDDDESGTNSQESNFSTSTQSQSSTGSFAFPVLRCDWNGSPVKMPKPEALHLRKHKPLRIGLQCCKF